MGEIYRADDLKLGHTVALKFLPKNLADDPQRLEYFHSEVRLTRQISHPNVCRVYDIGEFEGQHYLSMEYIDGEDLRVLLRRIGRLPSDKGVQIAQQLCAGLAAAHDRGVLHRDLKPANIMIDGRGQVRITDFGLAKLTEEATGGEIAGTPAYMAPEQLSRGEATIQSDLFALGLIFSELFTGKAVLKSGSIPDLMRAHESSLSQSVELSDDVDPAIGRVIRRCLEREPSDRPRSAHAVAAALPGGDPLAAALAAGETPSPEMVAASGETGQLSLRTAGICLAMLLVSLACLVPIVGRSSPVYGLDKDPAVYVAQAQDILIDLGLFDPKEYNAWGFAGTGGEDAKSMEFWYRQSPSEMVPFADPSYLHGSLLNSLQNPPPLVSGMVSMRLDRNDALRELLVIPSRVWTEQRPSGINQNPQTTADGEGENENQETEETSLAGTALLAAARLDREGFEDHVTIWDPEEARVWTPPVFADKAYSFVRREGGELLEADIQRVDVAEFDGHVVFFHVVDDTAMTPKTVAPLEIRATSLGFVLTILITFTAVVLAWRNVLSGRGDLRGARWLALLMFIVDSAEITLGSQFSPAVLMSGQLLALSSSARVWIYYVGLEPLARRYWPEMLVTWSRGLAGRVHDPGIGRDILYGMLIGIVFTLITFGLLGITAVPDPKTLCGTRFLFSELLGGLRWSFSFALQLAMAMVLVRAVVRNKWLPAIAAVLFVIAWHPDILSPLLDGPSSTQVAYAVGFAAYYFVTTILIARMGVLAAGSFMLCHRFFRQFPWSADWYGPDLPGTIFAVSAIVVCALYGFYTSVGGRVAFEDSRKRLESWNPTRRQVR